MIIRSRWLALFGVIGIMLLLLGGLFLGPLYVRAHQLSVITASSWTTVFTETFESPSTVWTLTDNVGGTYRWGVAPYVKDLGGTALMDHGLWAAGGGTVGQTQTWPTGTYTNSMTTWAVAGPFTPTQKAWDTRLSLNVYNDVAPDDVLFVGLSADGVHFQGITMTVSTLALQSVQWSTRAYSNSATVWIGLRFTSDAQGVAAGPMVDNVTLAFNYGSKAYLPLVKRDPTPTPSPTQQPLSAYFDGFDNPFSGWYTGPALRYNKWCRYTYFDCYEGWEVVATMSYFQQNYRIEIPLTWHGGGDVDTWFVWPVMAAPLPESYYPLPKRYCIEARGVFANWLDQDYQPYWAHWGILFGSNEQMTELYTFQVNANHDYAVLHHHNYIYPGNRQPLSGEDINVETAIVPWSTDIPYLIPTHAYNTLKVVVDGESVDVYVNNHWLRHAVIQNLPQERIGLIGGSWEVTPIDMQIDYFRYEPDCGPVQ
ncbi:MAG TPA: hypothetical protein PKZ84_14100 [Anaerolineae bacterium]|nr:hypothetical protein [Anaerolineae bacterium]HQI85813.1 hypothetical protein [Anaerolineae bacterium]